MDVYTFVSELVKALAWPATTVVLVLILRSPLVDLMRSLRKVKYKELEFEFDRELTELLHFANTVLVQRELEFAFDLLAGVEGSYLATPVSDSRGFVQVGRAVGHGCLISVPGSGWERPVQGTGRRSCWHRSTAAL